MNKLLMVGAVVGATFSLHTMDIDPRPGIGHAFAKTVTKHPASFFVGAGGLYHWSDWEGSRAPLVIGVLAPFVFHVGRKIYRFSDGTRAKSTLYSRYGFDVAAAGVSWWTGHDDVALLFGASIAYKGIRDLTQLHQIR